MSPENHIRNPFEMALEQLSWAFSDASHAVLEKPRARGDRTVPVIRRIDASDLWDALLKGVGDLGAVREDVAFIALIYPIAGLLLAQLAVHHSLLPLVFPLASGFALIGPVAAIGLYEISRRREQGLPVTWADAFGVLRSPALGSIFGLGLILLAVLLLWLAAAYGVYWATLGPTSPSSVSAFIHDVLETDAGWVMIVAGVGVGFLFAVLTLAISVVSFPLLLDRDVGIGAAIATSVRAVAANPGPMSLWGLIVASGLALGSAPALFGLILVVPLLGHATWHLYRKVIMKA
ncbi:MAG TPA: DUF2189 domain-containing protein [Caulobacteraceae bacterium]|nr:DUF2189 domain-containing protein [Caulobacteraceae bacterium]